MASKKGVEAAKAYVKGYWEDSAIARGIKRTAAGMNKLGEGMSSVGAKMAGVGAAVTAAMGGITAGLLKAVGAAGEMDAIFASFDVIFKSSADAVGRWSDQLADGIGRSKTDLRQFLTQTQSRFVAMEGIDPARAVEMSKALVKLGLDIAAFADKDDATAMQALQNAMTGEMEMMKQFGVVISAAQVTDKLKMMGLDPATATQAEAAQARFELIMQRTAAMQGTAAREAGEYGSMLKRLQAAVKDIAEEIGSALLPYVTRLLEWLTNGAKAIAQFAGQFKGASVAVAAGTLALGALATAATVVGGVLALLGSAISAVGAVAGAVSAPVLAIAAAIAAVTAAVGVFLAKSGAITVAWEEIKSRFENSVGVMKSAWDAFVGAIQSGNIADAFEALWIAFKIGYVEAFKGFYAVAIKTVKAVASYLYDSLKSALTLGGTGADTPGLMSRIGLFDSTDKMKARLEELRQRNMPAGQPQQQPVQRAAGPSGFTAGAGFQDSAMSADQAIATSLAVQERQAEEQRVYQRAMLAEQNRQAEAAFQAAKAQTEAAEVEEVGISTDAENRLRDNVSQAVNSSVALNTSEGANALGRALGISVGITAGDRLIASRIDRVDKSVRNNTISTGKVG